MTDYRKLCEKLADDLGGYHARVIEADGFGSYETEALLRLADEALAQRREEGWGPTDEEIMGLMPEQMHEDLATAACAMAEQTGADTRRVKGAMRIILNRHVVDLARAVLARWGNASR